MGMPWAKLQLLRRWLDTSGVSIVCEERDATDCKRHHWRKPEGRNRSIFTFRIASVDLHLLDENHSAGQLTWHDGIIPNMEI
ncbi:hypothetical protein EMCRGX_G004919 [Ephydatia muelleri]